MKDLTLLNHSMMPTNVSWAPGKVAGWLEEWGQPEKLGYSAPAEAQCLHPVSTSCPGGSYHAATTPTWFLYSPNPLCYNALLSHHQFITSLHLRLHRSSCYGPALWPASLYPGGPGINTPGWAGFWCCDLAKDCMVWLTVPFFCLAVHYHPTDGPYVQAGY